MLAQRCCKICGESFEVGGKRGRPRIYCLVCEPPGFQVVKVPHQERVRLRRRPSLVPRVPRGGWASVSRIAP